MACGDYGRNAFVQPAVRIRKNIPASSIGTFEGCYEGEDSIVWSKELSEGNETAKVHDRIAPFVYGHGIDLGCGCWKLKVDKTPQTSCIGVDGGYSAMA